MNAPTEPQHVGDVSVPCPVCETALEVPVLCEFVPAEPGSAVVALRCSPNLEPLREHARTHRGLSRPARQ